MKNKIDKEALRKRTEKAVSHPNYGKVVYSPDGRLQCHICGNYYTKLGSHVYMSHHITSFEYKVMFGLNTKPGLVSDSHKKVLRENNSSHYQKVVFQNLKLKGATTRFKKGSSGRYREITSEQTRIKLISNLNMAKKMCNTNMSKNVQSN